MVTTHLPTLLFMVSIVPKWSFQIGRTCYEQHKLVRLLPLDLYLSGSISKLQVSSTSWFVATYLLVKFEDCVIKRSREYVTTNRNNYISNLPPRMDLRANENCSFVI